MNHTIRQGSYTIRQHFMDGACRKTALSIAHRTKLNPPPYRGLADQLKGETA